MGQSPTCVHAKQVQIDPIFWLGKCFCKILPFSEAMHGTSTSRESKEEWSKKIQICFKLKCALIEEIYRFYCIM
jgi:hypothetical protein